MSCIPAGSQRTGRPHLGNLPGAIRPAIDRYLGPQETAAAQLEALAGTGVQRFHSLLLPYVMRTFVLLAALLLPQLGWAQLFGPGFQPGTYVLNGSRTQRRQGQLKVQRSHQLLVKDEAGKTLKFKADEVYYARIGSRKYVSVGDFHVMGGIGGVDVESAFAEQLDSGRIMLLRYEYSIGGPSMGAGGTMVGGGTMMRTYLLSSLNGLDVAAAQAGAYSSGGKNFREAVRPFFLSRPDLLKLLDEKRINENNLPAAVRAFNTNSPLTPPAALNMD